MWFFVFVFFKPGYGGIPIIPALGRLRQEVLELEVTLCDIVSP
jgi:hypothetical protein